MKNVKLSGQREQLRSRTWKNHLHTWAFAMYEPSMHSAISLRVETWQQFCISWHHNYSPVPHEDGSRSAVSPRAVDERDAVGGREEKGGLKRKTIMF